MILASPDLASSLRHWVLAEYVSEGFVILGCAGELVADLATCILRRKRKHLERWSTILLVVALSVGLKCLVRTNELSGSVIGSLGDKAEEADRKAKTAIADSSTALSQAKDALTKAGNAADSLGKAKDEAKKAQTASLNALTLARGARQEADSFEKDIVSAKEQAARAESHLAEALWEAAQATEELNRLKTPRSLPNAPALIFALQEFKGTEYTFIGVFQDEESIGLLKQIDNALQLAGWLRVKRPPCGHFGDIEVNVFKDFGVPPSPLSGVFVEVESSEKLDSLQARPQSLLPRYIRAAIALKSGLATGISPTQEDLRKPLNVSPGNTTVAFILVGKKQ